MLSRQLGQVLPLRHAQRLNRPHASKKAGSV
ncbi:Uncharacterised protein [Vibrio cholerae]|nr:Uncharacterised protein [Vibrio cholerae]